MESEKILAIVKEIGLTFKKTKVMLAGEAISDNQANNLLAQKGTSLEEVRKALAEQAKKPIEIPDNLRYKDHLSNMEVISPAFTSDSKWNKADEKLFRFFYLARAVEGGGMLLLVHNGDSEFRAVLLSNSPLSNLADITSTCSRMSYVDPETKVKRTLYDYMLKTYEKIMEEALEVYKKSDAIEFGNWATKGGIPSLMLNNYKLMSVQEEKEIENEGGGKITMYHPYSLFFTESPLQCLANHYDTLAGVPTRLVKIPRLYSNDMAEPALYHLDLDKIIDHENPHPSWDKFMRRFNPDEGKVLKAFIWSIFDADNTGRQLLYIYDPQGFAGKSVLQGAITSGIGENLVMAVQKDSLNNQFAMAKIWNKRLVVIDDNKNPNLIRSEKMHMALGSGLADVEEKGKKSFLYKMQCKVLASGNVRINIDPDANHERTRVIVIEPHLTDDMLKEFVLCDKDGNIVRDRKGRPKFIGDKTFEDNMKKEFRSFLAECKEAYEELCPTRSSIIISDDMEEVIDSLSDDVYDILDEKICSKMDFSDKGAAMPVSVFSKTVNSILLDLHVTDSEIPTYDNVVQHIIKKFGIKKVTRRIGGIPTKCYLGARLSKAGNNIVSVTEANKKAEADFANDFLNNAC